MAKKGVAQKSPPPQNELSLRFFFVIQDTLYYNLVKKYICSLVVPGYFNKNAMDYHFSLQLLHILLCFKYLTNQLQNAILHIKNPQ